RDPKTILRSSSTSGKLRQGNRIAQGHNCKKDRALSTHVTIEVGEGEAGSRIDRFLGHRFYPAYSRSFLTGLIASGEILVNGRPVRPAYRIGPGDTITAHLAPQTESSPAAEPIELRIVDEDDHLLVVDKPAGMVVHPGPGTK